MKKNTFLLFLLIMLGLSQIQAGNLPIIPSTDTGAGAVWYTIYFDAGPDTNGYRGFCALNATSLGKINIDGGNPNVADERYQFCFIGDEVNGFEIYNRAFLAGKTVKKFDNTTDITLTADSKMQTVAADGGSDLWIAFPETALAEPVTKWFFQQGDDTMPGGGGGIKEAGEWTLYSPKDNKGMNINGGSLVYYQTIDWGTTWRLSFHRVTGQNEFPVTSKKYYIKNLESLFNLSYKSAGDSIVCNTGDLNDEVFQFEFEPITGNESYGNFYRLKNVASGTYVKAPDVTTVSNRIVLTAPFGFTSDANDLDNIACRLQQVGENSYKIIFKKNNVAVTVCGTEANAGIRCDYEVGETPLAGHPQWEITDSPSVTEPEEGLVQAFAANDFLNSIGVNSSIDRRGETYANTRKLAQYLGFRYIRADVGSSIWQLKEMYEDFRVRYSISLGQNNAITSTVDFAKRLVNSLGADALIGLEGPNEPNNWKITYNGETQTDNDYMPLAKYQRDFYAAVKADDVLKDYPVWSYTDAGGAQPKNYGLQYLTIPASETALLMPAGTTFADVATVHNYFSATRSRTNNQTWEASDRFHVNGLKSNFGVTWRGQFQGYTDDEIMELPWVTTETGVTIDGYDTTEEYQAKTYLTCYLAQFAHGAEYTAMYILRDRSDEGGNQTFGFYQPDYTPRLSAHYLHNMTTILADTVSIENPGTMEYTISRRTDSPNANLETVHDMLLQKNDGSFMLIVWGERFQRSGKADKINIRFGQNFDIINVYNPAQYDAANPGAGVLPIETYRKTYSLDLDVLDRPFILEFNKEPASTGISTVEQEQSISVYPNGDVLNIVQCDGAEQYEIFDLLGKRLLTGKVNTAGHAQIDIATLRQGSYIIRLMDKDNNVQSCKFINSNL